MKPLPHAAGSAPWALYINSRLGRPLGYFVFVPLIGLKRTLFTNFFLRL